MRLFCRLEEEPLRRIQVRYFALTVVSLLLLGAAAFWIMTLLNSVE